MSKTQEAATTENVPAWECHFMAAYRVEPAERDGDKLISLAEGSTLSLDGQAAKYLGGLFARAEEHYRIGIDFKPDSGKQQNKVREAVMRLANGTKAERKKAAHYLGTHLSATTPGQAKTGLLAVAVGTKDEEVRIVAWRFTAGASFHFKPNTSDDSDADLTIDEAAFTKSSQKFKAAFFQDKPGPTAFWHGRVRDNQSHMTKLEHAQYWVNEFLQAKSAMTDERGTGILSNVAAKTIRETKGDVRENIVKAAQLVQTQKGKAFTLAEFAETYLTPDASKAFLANCPPGTTGSPFKLSKNIISTRLGMRRVTINKLVSIQAPDAQFDKLVEETTAPDGTPIFTVRGEKTSTTLQPLG